MPHGCHDDSLSYYRGRVAGEEKVGQWREGVSGFVDKMGQGAALVFLSMDEQRDYLFNCSTGRPLPNRITRSCQ